MLAIEKLKRVANIPVHILGEECTGAELLSRDLQMIWQEIYSCCLSKARF